MTGHAVTRDGVSGAAPEREARTWSGAGNGGPPPREAHDHPSTSYYGEPIINPPVWEELNIAGYLFTGGLAGASSLIAAGADLTGRPRLARRSRLCASAAIGVSLVALIKDLGRPARFLNMLRVLKPSSPMSVGTWILVMYSPLNLTASAGDVLGRWPRTGRAAGVGAGVLGSAVATYTAALICDTAVPAWHDAHREMPFVFAGSATSAAAGFALLAAPAAECAPVRRMAILGAVAEYVSVEVLERRLAPVVAEAVQEGTAGRRLRIAKALTAAGAVGAAVVAPRSRLGAALAGASLLVGSVFSRFGLFAAGMASARDPRYTVEPQRARRDGRRARPA